MWRIDLGVAREEEGGTLRRLERVVTWKQTEWGSILKGELIKLADELWLGDGRKGRIKDNSLVFESSSWVHGDGVIY